MAVGTPEGDKKHFEERMRLSLRKRNYRWLVIRQGRPLLGSGSSTEGTLFSFLQAIRPLKGLGEL